jgi:hypothetical protein
MCIIIAAVLVIISFMALPNTRKIKELSLIFCLPYRIITTYSVILFLFVTIQLYKFDVKRNEKWQKQLEIMMSKYRLEYCKAMRTEASFVLLVNVICNANRNTTNKSLTNYCHDKFDHQHNKYNILANKLFLHSRRKQH